MSENKRELLRSILAGEVSADEFAFNLRWSNGAIVGVLNGDQVKYSDPVTGDEKSATKAEFERLAGKYIAIRADILGPCPPITDESEIPVDI